MISTEDQRKKFEEAVKPLIKFLNEECPHPHHKVVVDKNSAEILEGCVRIIDNSFIED